MRNLLSLLAALLIIISAFAQEEAPKKGSFTIDPYVGFVNVLQTPTSEINYNTFSELAVGFMSTYYFSEKWTVAIDGAGFYNGDMKPFTHLRFRYNGQRDIGGKQVGWMFDLGKTSSLLTRHHPFPITFDYQFRFKSETMIQLSAKLTSIVYYSWESGWGVAGSVSERGLKLGDETEYAFQIKKDDFKATFSSTNGEVRLAASYAKAGAITGMIYYEKGLVSSWISFPLKNDFSIFVDAVVDLDEDNPSIENDFLEVGLLKDYNYEMFNQNFSGKFGLGLRNDETSIDTDDFTVNVYFGIYLNNKQ